MVCVWCHSKSRSTFHHVIIYSIIPWACYYKVISFYNVLDHNQYYATLVAWVVLRSSTTRDFLSFELMRHTFELIAYSISFPVHISAHGTFAWLVRWSHGGRQVVTRWMECLVRVRCCWNDVSPFDDLQDWTLPQLSLYPCSFSAGWYYGLLLHSASISCSCKFYFVTSVSLHMYFVMRVCWFVCSSLMLRIFGMMSLKIGYRILNCIINLWSLIFGFYLSLGFPQVLFKVIFCCSYCFVYSFLFGIRLCRSLFLSVFVFLLECITDFAKTGQVSDDTIKLINY